MINQRAIALDIIIEILEEKKPLHIAVSDKLSHITDADVKERAFINKLVRGTVERCITVDYVIDKISSTPVRKQKPFIRNLLRLSVYQLMYTDVPESAVCNEAVKLANKRHFSTLSGFVNGVLRNIIRRRQELMDFNSISDTLIRISVEYSVPEWLVTYWSRYYPNEMLVKAFTYFLKDTKVACRCNISKIEPENLKKSLSDKGYILEAGRLLSKCFYLESPGALNSISEFRSGQFCVQDETSVLATELALLKKGDKVLDLCAAPGGKTLNAADILTSSGGKADVVSCDISEVKTALIKDNLSRCAFNDTTVMINDASVYNPEFEDQFDVVIADVPCSGLGIIGKKPDIKLNASLEKMRDLVPLQQEILGNAAKYVKKGGRLVFSTCTVNADENENNADYIKTQLGLKPVDISEILPAAVKCETAKDGYIQIFPGQYDTDGFFIALFERR